MTDGSATSESAKVNVSFQADRDVRDQVLVKIKTFDRSMGLAELLRAALSHAQVMGADDLCDFILEGRRYQLTGRMKRAETDPEAGYTSVTSPDVPELDANAQTAIASKQKEAKRLAEQNSEWIQPEERRRLEGLRDEAIIQFRRGGQHPAAYMGNVISETKKSLDVRRKLG